MLYSRFPLAIHFTHGSVHMLEMQKLYIKTGPSFFFLGGEAQIQASPFYSLPDPICMPKVTDRCPIYVFTTSHLNKPTMFLLQIQS